MGSPRLHAFAQLSLARFREFYRESEAVFWAFVFPILLSVALGLAFRNKPAEVLKVAVLDGPDAGAAAATLRSSGLFRVEVLSEPEAARALRLGRVALVAERGAAGALLYRFDPSRPESSLARHAVDEALQRAAGRSDPLPIRDSLVSEPGSRYIDFLIPGIVGMGILNNGLWGVGFHLVDMRIKKLLKRLLATPMRRSDFMAAHMGLRAVTMFVEVGFLLLFARYALGVPVYGSWGAVFAVGAIGALASGGMGLLLASRATRIETIMGLMNLVTLPMVICSGVFFSVERFPEAAQPLIRALPLTLLIDALRAVVLEGADLASQAARLGGLAAWGVVGFVTGLRLFRWS